MPATHVLAEKSEGSNSTTADGDHPSAEPSAAPLRLTKFHLDPRAVARKGTDYSHHADHDPPARNGATKGSNAEVRDKDQGNSEPQPNARRCTFPLWRLGDVGTRLVPKPTRGLPNASSSISMSFYRGLPGGQVVENVLHGGDHVG